MLIVLFLFSKWLCLYKIAISCLIFSFFYAICSSIWNFFFTCFLFFYCNHIFSIVGAIKKMTIKELKDFVYEKYYEWVRFIKESTYYSTKHQRRSFLSFATKLIEKWLFLLIPKNQSQLKRRKHKSGKKNQK